MRILLDTNVLLSNFQSTREDHDTVREALRRLVTGGWELCICDTVIYEFWAVATRSAKANGLGLEPAAAAAELDQILAAYLLLPEPPDMLLRWRAFCLANQVRGNRCHDARIAALMSVAGVEDILTQNGNDFEGWIGIRPVAPTDA